MTERPRDHTEYVGWETGGVIGRMKAMLAEAGQFADADEEVLLQHVGLFNRMLGADKSKSTPLSVVFETGPDLYRNDSSGNVVHEEPGQVRYGVVSRCAVFEDVDSSSTRLAVQIRLHPNDRDDFADDGAYYGELASFGEELSINDLRLHEVERPAIDPGSKRGRLNRSEQTIEDRYVENACLVDDWLQEYRDSSDETVPISTLLSRICEVAQYTSSDQTARYVDEQVAVFNLLVSDENGDEKTMVVCRGLVEKQVDGTYETRQGYGRYEDRYVDELEMVVYAMDASWIDGRIEGHLYCFDIKGNTVRCRLEDQAVDINLFIGAGFEAEDDDWIDPVS